MMGAAAACTGDGGFLPVSGDAGSDSMFDAIHAAEKSNTASDGPLDQSMVFPDARAMLRRKPAVLLMHLVDLLDEELRSPLLVTTSQNG